MKPNEQTQNEQFAKESLILKGIANNLLSMQFPKFKNLIEMLEYFDYEVKIEPKIFDTENSVVAFFQKHKELKSASIDFEYKLAQKNSTYNKISNVFAGILKKIVLCENILTLYMQDEEKTENYYKRLVDFDKNHERYFRIIEFLSEMQNVLTPNLPIFQYDNKTYSIGEQEFKDEFELYEFFRKFHLDKFFVYQFRIYNDNTIKLRYCKEK